MFSFLMKKLRSGIIGPGILEDSLEPTMWGHDVHCTQSHHESHSVALDNGGYTISWILVRKTLLPAQSKTTTQVLVTYKI